MSLSTLTSQYLIIEQNQCFFWFVYCKVEITSFQSDNDDILYKCVYVKKSKAEVTGMHSHTLSTIAETVSRARKHCQIHFLTYFSSLAIHCIVWSQTVAVCKVLNLKPMNVLHQRIHSSAREKFLKMGLEKEDEGDRGVGCEIMTRSVRLGKSALGLSFKQPGMHSTGNGWQFGELVALDKMRISHSNVVLTDSGKHADSHHTTCCLVVDQQGLC